MSFNIRLDIDPVVICPYNKSHKIARSRIQRHLVKCEKNYPPDYKQECPYDATHRVFEHELVQHVETCPMKMSNPLIDTIYDAGKVPELEPEVEDSVQKDDMWDEEEAASTTNSIIDESNFDPINIKQYTNITSIRGNFITKRFNSKLRRPFGYSESMMLDISDQSFDDDTQSITSDMGIGRGQGLLSNSRGQHTRGLGLYRRGLRGRLLH